MKHARPFRKAGGVKYRGPYGKAEVAERATWRIQPQHTDGEAACQTCGFTVPVRKSDGSLASHRVVRPGRPAKDGWLCPGSTLSPFVDKGGDWGDR